MSWLDLLGDTQWIMWAGATFATGTLAGSATVAAARSQLWRWRNARFRRDARLVTVSVPPTVEPSSAEIWWSHQVGLLAPWWKRWIFGQPHLAFEYVADAARTRIQIWVPGTVPPGMIEKAVRAAWPGATVTTSQVSPPIPPDASALGGRLAVGRADHYPLASEQSADPLRPLLSAVAGLGRHEYAAIQVLARPVTGRRLGRAHRAAGALRGGRSGAPQGRLFDLLTPGVPMVGQPGELARLHPERAEQVRAILHKAGGPRFEVQLRYAVATTEVPASPGRLRGRAHELASAFALYSSGHQHLRRHRLRRPPTRLASRRFDRGYLLSVPELAALAHLPLDPDAPGITRSGARPVAAPPEVPSAGEARIVGDTEAGHLRPVALPVIGARQHVHVLGQTGVGKSTLIASMVLADAEAGRGALVIDPKGDLITDVLDRLPDRLIDQTVIFDPTDPSPPPSVNVLAGPDPGFAVESIVTIFHRCFSSAWGPRLDDLMRSACLTLTRVQGSRATLAQVPRLLTDTPYRARITARLDDELLTGFWASYDDLSPAGRSAVIGPVMNKLRAVMLRPFVHDALSAGESTVDLGRTLDSGGLVLARLPKGVLGEDATRLFGSLLLAHTWQGMTRRATVPEAHRRDAAGYIDECQNFLNLPGSVSDILAEARGYRFSLILAHQHLSQLPKDLRESISADARNKIYFTASPEDARELVQHVAPLLTAHDLAHLGAHQAAGRFVVGAAQTRAFTFRTRPIAAAKPGRQEAVRAASRERFAAKRPLGRRKPAQLKTAADPRNRRES